MRAAAMEALRKLDERVYRAERWLVVAALIVMSVVVFLDVVHRTFADPHSKLADWIARLAGIDDGTAGAIAPVTLFLFFVWLTYFAMRTARRSRAIPRTRAVGVAVAVVVVAYGLVRLMILAVPNGFIWSQPLALILVLWVGFLGASMCTRDGKHLKVEAVQRYLPESVRPKVGFVSALITAAFCLFLAWVSWDYVVFNFREWIETEGKGGLFKGIDVPKWVGFAVLPASFLIMTARFVGRSWSALRGELPETDVLDGIKPARAHGAEGEGEGAA